jgi:TolA-binding protein
MSPYVTTFRPTWAGALGGLALFALALLPNPARAQTNDAEDELKLRLEKLTNELAKAQDASQSQSELERARAELAKLQADIKIRQEQIKLLEAKIAAMQAHKGGDTVKERIVIRGGGDDRNPNEIVLILRKVGDRWEVVQPPAKKPDAKGWEVKPKPETKQPEHRDFRVEEKDGVLRIVPVEPGKVPATGERPRDPRGQPDYRPVPVPGSPADARLENLERQLKKIMDEIESLRTEMKSQPRSGATREETSHRIELRFDDLQKSLPPGTKVEEKDGVRYFTIPLEVKPAPKPDPQPAPNPRPTVERN